MRRNLRAERIRFGMSAEEVGRRIDRSAHSVLLYELGKVDPPGTVVVKLSKLYQREPEYLMHKS